jgi:hypothetical protein
MAKIAQLQIRVSAAEKAVIQDAARQARMDMSAWVLSKVLSAAKREFHHLLTQLSLAKQPRFVLAGVHDYLAQLPATGFEEAMDEWPAVTLSKYLSNYVAAMVEYAAAQKGVIPPPWAESIKPLEKPVFVSELKSLRLHLLLHSPPPFRRRNIFIDTSIGARV